MGSTIKQITFILVGVILSSCVPLSSLIPPSHCVLLCLLVLMRSFPFPPYPPPNVLGSWGPLNPFGPLTGGPGYSIASSFLPVSSGALVPGSWSACLTFCCPPGDPCRPWSTPGAPGDPGPTLGLCSFTFPPSSSSSSASFSSSASPGVSCPPCGKGLLGGPEGRHGGAGGILSVPGSCHHLQLCRIIIININHRCGASFKDEGGGFEEGNDGVGG